MSFPWKPGGTARHTDVNGGKVSKQKASELHHMAAQWLAESQAPPGCKEGRGDDIPITAFQLRKAVIREEVPGSAPPIAYELSMGAVLHGPSSRSGSGLK